MLTAPCVCLTCVISSTRPSSTRTHSITHSSDSPGTSRTPTTWPPWPWTPWRYDYASLDIIQRHMTTHVVQRPLSWGNPGANPVLLCQTIACSFIPCCCISIFLCFEIVISHLDYSPEVFECDRFGDRITFLLKTDLKKSR